MLDTRYQRSLLDTVGLQKKTQGSIIEGEGDFGATVRVKTGQFTWHSEAS